MIGTRALFNGTFGNVDTSKRFYDAALEPVGYKYLRGPEIAIGLRARKYKTARLSRFPVVATQL